MKLISAQKLKPLLTLGNEIAFLDVREHGQYGEGHPFFSIPFPYSRLESLANVLLPGKLAQLVLFDDSDGVAERAAGVLEELGYQNVFVLEGGAPGWAAAGYTLFKGVNVPSKTFGELLEHAADTPRVTAAELHDLKEANPSVVVLDGRSPGEYRKMSLPGALCCPNAELGYRIQSLVPDPSTTVVVNCAGRTRSILGVEGLRIVNANNPVFALENGTQGWRLAGFDLEHGVEPQQLPLPDSEQLAAMADQAKTIIAEHELSFVSPEGVLDWQNDEALTTYLLDVRTKAEFDASHWPGARHAPGGQLVQATDQFVAVRYARIVLCDDVHLRAATTAVRLKQMGHDVYLLDANVASGEKSESSTARENPNGEGADKFPGDLLANGVTVLDASPGMDYRDAHIDGARWVTRARLFRLQLAVDEPIFVTGQDDVLIESVCKDLVAAGYSDVRSRPGSPKVWISAGYDVVATPDNPSETDCIDYLFFVHDRHDGNLDAARRYLEWEVGLVDQLDAQERSVLNPHKPQ